MYRSLSGAYNHLQERVFDSLFIQERSSIVQVFCSCYKPLSGFQYLLQLKSWVFVLGSCSLHLFHMNPNSRAIRQAVLATTKENRLVVTRMMKVFFHPISFNIAGTTIMHGIPILVTTPKVNS